MNNQPVVDRINNIFIWVTRIAVLNILWMLFTLAGIVVFGIFPATVASLKICLDWVNKKTEFSIWKNFVNEFKQSFFVANGAGWILLIVGFIFYINSQLFDRITGVIYFLSLFSFYFIIILYIFICAWIFPLIAHYQNNLFSHFRNSLIIGFGKLKYTFSIILFIFLIAYISLLYPGIIPFFTFGIGSLIWAWISAKVFNEIDENHLS